MKKFVYQMTLQEALAHLNTDMQRGLDEQEAAQRLEKFGPNALHTAKGESLISLFLDQFKDPLVLLLILAVGLAYYLKDHNTAIILAVIVVTNGVIGFYQEYSAEKVLEALKKIVRGKATVIREGKRREIEKEELVSGDIVYLEEGSAIPADLRLLKTHFCSTNDFILTGESVPKEKKADIVIEDVTTLTNQDNLVFMGTTVAKGSALAVVYGTGMDTAMGRIAKSSETIERNLSTLQIEINHIAKILTKIAGWVALVLFVLNVLLSLRVNVPLEAAIQLSLLFALSIAASCVPQGLPTQITVSLSLGVRRLVKENAVIKKLSSVETLGSTTVICTDKTGTLTKNEMTITQCYAYDRIFDISGTGYEPDGCVLENSRELTDEVLAPIQSFFSLGFLASNGRALPPDEDHSGWYANGDPTEVAFTPLAAKAGFDLHLLEKTFPLFQELPFDSNRKRMTLFRENQGRTLGFMKGALDSVLSCCSHIQGMNGIRVLSEEDKKRIESLADTYAAQALRVIALAHRQDEKGHEPKTIEKDEQGFTFAGFVCMIDPPREGVKEAIAACYEAKIRVIMITGDSSITAKAIAKQIGMIGDDQKRFSAYTGDEIKKQSDNELKQTLSTPSLIFSRVSPEDKLRIVGLLKDMGEVVAVTGDGVNDTLSLKKANIGVAMGKGGSEVAKEAAEIVLLDDNFSTLILAIREGRTIFANLKKTVLGNITANLGELTTVLIGFAFLSTGLPLPITAVQILAVDLVSELLPLIALTLDPAEKGLMKSPPRKMGDHMVNRLSFLSVMAFGIAIGAFAYYSFYRVYHDGGSYAAAQTTAYITITLCQLLNLIGARTNAPLFSRYTLSNVALWGSIGLSLIMASLLIYIPFIAFWFKFEGLSVAQWLWPILSGLGILALHELRKKGLKWKTV